MHTLRLPASDPSALDQAERLLRQGALVAFPTDTVYGVGAALFDPPAIDALYAAKGRDAAKAIAVLLGDPADLGLVAGKMGPNAARLANRFWPGPLTLVVPALASLPPNLSPLPTVGVRMPDHPAALALLRRTGPLAVTSANLSGQPSPSDADEVLAQLGGHIALVLDGGRTPGGSPSTVVDCTTPDLVILRPGPLSLEELQSAL